MVLLPGVSDFHSDDYFVLEWKKSLEASQTSSYAEVDQDAQGEPSVFRRPKFTSMWKVLCLIFGVLGSVVMSGCHERVHRVVFYPFGRRMFLRRCMRFYPLRCWPFKLCLASLCWDVPMFS